MHDLDMNKSLITLTKELTDLEVRLIESDGEISPETEAQLASISRDLAHKIDNYDLIISGLKKKAEFYKQKADEFQRANRAIINFIERLKANLKVILPQFPNSEIKGEHAYYKLVTSGKKLVIDDENKLPSKYKITVSNIVPDKELILSNLEDGIPVEGAHLEDIIQLRGYSAK